MTGRPFSWSVLALAVPLAASGLLSGCADGERDDLSQWMAQQRASAQPKVPAVLPPSSFTPQAYLGSEAVSPFSEERLTRVLRSDTSAAASRLIEAEMRRPREPLEAFPLDAMAMVGLLDKGGRRVALVQVNGLLYQVSVGTRMGQNFGRVTAITENQIALREIVQDATGEWIERTATLQLQEGTGP